METNILCDCINEELIICDEGCQLRILLEELLVEDINVDRIRLHDWYIEICVVE